MPRSGNTTERGYGADHQRERRRWQPLVASGTAECAEPECLDPGGREIDAEAAWDLAHDRANGGYLGPAHRACNRSEGARYGALFRGGQGTPSDVWGEAL